MSAEDLTLEFRTGKRVVLEHLYHELAQLETHTMTYDEAVAEANKARERRFLDDIGSKVVSDHFSTQRRGF